MALAEKRKKWLITVDQGDYIHARTLAKEMNIPLGEVVRHVFKRAQDLDPDELRQTIERHANEFELERIQNEKQKLNAREREIKMRLTEKEEALSK